MRKILVALSFIGYAMFGSAAIIQWNLYDFTGGSGNGNLLAGTAYLVQYTSDTTAPTIESIRDSLVQSGLGEGSSDFVLRDTADAVTDGEIGFSSDTGRFVYDVDMKNGNNMFVVVVLDDGTFYISDYIDRESMDAGGGVPQYSYEFISMFDSEHQWHSGKLGAVPEISSASTCILMFMVAFLRRRKHI